MDYKGEAFNMTTIKNGDSKMKLLVKICLIVIVMALTVAIQSEIIWASQRPIVLRNRAIIRQLPIDFLISKTYRSLGNSRSQLCGENEYCGTLTGAFDAVYGQVGIYYYNTNVQSNVFLPLYVKEAALLNNEYILPYRIPKWDGKVFWLKISSDKPPVWIQPFYLDDDPSCAGCMKFISHGMVYKNGEKLITNPDYYADWPYGGALTYMYIRLDSSFRVKDYTIDVYDIDDNLPPEGEGLKLNIGDQIQSIFVEDDNNDETGGWEFVYMDDPVTVTQEPLIEYAGYIPGRNFMPTAWNGKLSRASDHAQTDLADIDLYYRFVGYVVDPDTQEWSPVDPKGSVSVPMGKLKDYVCTAYPELTTKDPTLADVVEGLRILAFLAPQNFCFRDVNSDNKFDMADVVWMLQKTAASR
jgi:hypothetical protein